MSKQYIKVPIEVNLHIKKDGTVKPKSFVWKDGNTYKIDRVLKIERAASDKTGIVGIRYTVVIKGLPDFIFDEDGKWFIEEEINY